MGAHKANFNPLICGQIGAGKSNLLRYLIQFTPRVIVFDKMGEYDTAPAFHSFKEAGGFLIKNRERNFHLIFDTMDPDAYLAMMELAFDVQMSDQSLPPLALFVEEASFFSSSHTLPKPVDLIYTKGRHARINLVTIVQRMTQVHTITRDQCHVWVLMKLMSLPGDAKQRLPSGALEEIRGLETYLPGQDPEYGRHFITDQGPSVDVVERWIRFNPGAPIRAAESET